MSSRPTPKQWEIILDFLEKNEDMVSGRGAGQMGRINLKEKWETLAAVLNSLGYANKTAEKWLKTWTDFKCNLKKKAAEIKKEERKTGGGPPTSKILNEFEQRALPLLGPTFIGLDVAEVGLSSNSNIMTDQQSVAGYTTASEPTSSFESFMDEFGPSTSTKVFPTLQKRTYSQSQATSSTSAALQEHNYSHKKSKQNLPVVEEAYVETSDVLRSIQSTLSNNLGDISEHLKEIKKELISKKRRRSTADVASAAVLIKFGYFKGS